MLKLQERLWRSVGTLEYFTSNQWIFTNQNVIDLQHKLYAEDQEVSMQRHIWIFVEKVNTKKLYFFGMELPTPGWFQIP